MYAADGMRILFPSRYRRSEFYDTAESVEVEIYLDVDTTGLAEPEDILEAGPDGEIDFGSIADGYHYAVLITIRQPTSWIPLSAADLVPAPVPLSVAISMATPTSMGYEGTYSRSLGNGITAKYFVHH